MNTEKPHIWYSVWHGIWFCQGMLVTGRGEDPTSAYKSWWFKLEETI